MHKCGVGRVVTCLCCWLHSFPASSFYKRYARLTSFYNDPLQGMILCREACLKI